MPLLHETVLGTLAPIMIRRIDCKSPSPLINLPRETASTGRAASIYLRLKPGVAALPRLLLCWVFRTQAVVVDPPVLLVARGPVS